MNELFVYKLSGFDHDFIVGLLYVLIQAEHWVFILSNNKKIKKKSLWMSIFIFFNDEKSLQTGPYLNEVRFFGTASPREEGTT